MTELMLKLAAFLAMVIDHAAACRLDRVFFPAFSKVYVISRAIGRMAFPIYTFCLVEGFRHSHDLRRYGGNHPRQRLFMEENQQNQPDKQRKQNI